MSGLPSRRRGCLAATSALGPPRRNSRRRLVRLSSGLWRPPPATTRGARLCIFRPGCHIEASQGKKKKPEHGNHGTANKKNQWLGWCASERVACCHFGTSREGARLQKALAAWRITPGPITLRCLPIPTAARRHTEWHPATGFLGSRERALQRCQRRGGKPARVPTVGDEAPCQPRQPSPSSTDGSSRRAGHGGQRNLSRRWQAGQAFSPSQGKTTAKASTRQTSLTSSPNKPRTSPGHRTALVTSHSWSLGVGPRRRQRF